VTARADFTPGEAIAGVMTAHLGRLHPGSRHASERGCVGMSHRYRITIRGVMSERFSRGFPEMTRLADNDRTILVGALPDDARLAELLRRLDNLGIEVIDVACERAPAPQRRITGCHAWPTWSPGALDGW
jgi:hypothetical protein